MASLNDIVDALNAELNLVGIPDYGAAMNGLQLTNEKPITKVAAAVDASLPVVERAVEIGADFLVVHHGMFWQGAQMITGGYYKKLKLAMDAGLAIYSAHIPLDVHPVLGNNAILADKIGLKQKAPFHPWKGIELGISGEFIGDFGELLAAVERATGEKAHFCNSGDSSPGRVGIITGGAGSDVAAIFTEGIDTLITGEGPHWSYTYAQESSKNIIYGGHYATETFGVIALISWLYDKFQLKGEFIHIPTGL